MDGKILNMLKFPKTPVNFSNRVFCKMHEKNVFSCKCVENSFGSLLHMHFKKMIGSSISSRLIHSTTSDLHFVSPSGKSEGSFTLWPGKDRSLVDKVLSSQLSCEIGSNRVDFVTFAALLGPNTEVPHLLFEFQFVDDNKMTMSMDFLPRRDLVCNIEYLRRYYENSRLQKVREELENDKRVKLFMPKRLFVRCATSPIACMFTFGSQADTRDEDSKTLESFIHSHVLKSTNEIFSEWLGFLSHEEGLPTVAESGELSARDCELIRHGIEYELQEALPKLFDQEITDEILNSFRKC